MKIKKKHKNYKVIITCSTRSGQKTASSLFKEDTVLFLPFDFPWLTLHFLYRLKPQNIIISESEFWPNFILTAHLLNIPILWVNGRVSPSSSKKLNLINKIFPILSLINQACVQNVKEKESFQNIGIKTIYLTGQLKFSTPIPIHTHTNESYHWKNPPVCIGISTHHPEEEILTKAFIKIRKSLPSFKLLIAPRHPYRTKQIINHITKERTQFKVQTFNQNFIINSQSDIFILDTLGQIPTYLPCANFAFIGGSLIPHGGQSPIEALAYNIPILYGPSIFNFSDIIQELTEQQSIIRVQNSSDIADKIIQLINTPQNIKKITEKSSLYFKKQQQDLEKTYNCIKKYYI